MPNLNRSNLVFAQTVACSGAVYRPKDPVPPAEKIPDSLITSWIKQGIVKTSTEVAARPAGLERIEPAGKQRLDEERAKKKAEDAVRTKAAEDAAAAAGQPVRLPMDTALDPSLVASMDIDELNVLAVERGYAGKPFAEAAPAINFLSANFPR